MAVDGVAGHREARVALVRLHRRPQPLRLEFVRLLFVLERLDERLGLRIALRRRPAPAGVARAPWIRSFVPLF